MKRLLLVAISLSILAMPVRAEPGPIGQWLMSEPVTLWDWGMMRMKVEADRAAEEAWRWTVDENKAFDWTGSASYSWDNNEIDVLVNVFGPDVSRDEAHRSCNNARNMFLATLSGTYDMTDKEGIQASLHAKIDHWFSHSGFASLSRDEQLAEKLARIIFVSVRLWPPAEGGGYVSMNECRARIMEFDAPSKPLDG